MNLCSGCRQVKGITGCEMRKSHPRFLLLPLQISPGCPFPAACAKPGLCPSAAQPGCPGAVEPRGTMKRDPWSSRVSQPRFPLLPSAMPGGQHGSSSTFPPVWSSDIAGETPAATKSWEQPEAWHSLWRCWERPSPTVGMEGAGLGCPGNRCVLRDHQSWGCHPRIAAH